jgi:hypothetical protein
VITDHTLTDVHMTTSIAATERKPRLVFFQFEYSPKLPEFLLIHKQEHAACLSQFFEVTVVDKDCDYQEICERYQPDLTLFESGVPNPACRRPKIRNTHTHPAIPKLGFLHADGFCCAREGFLSDMDGWGIEWFVAIATSAPEHMPSIADKLFIWPNSVDPTTYRDYEQWKSIPVLFTGNKNDIYPWRRTMIKIIPAHYPAMICPHPGYGTKRNVGNVPVGESYARMLNAAWFVPACGTVAKEVVRKHFEIPACGSCLVTERSPALEAAGFVDMVNCVFADEHNVIEKLSQLLRDKERLQAVIDAGHKLVMSRHTNEHRSQVLQWYLLQKKLTRDQRIVQPNPFGELALVESTSVPSRPYAVSGAHHLTLLREGDEKLQGGDYASAESLYLKSANYITYMPEPKVRLAVCQLYMGKAAMALWWIAQPLQFTLAQYKAADPDPVEWAYFIVALLCLGDVVGATKSAEEFEWLRHPELDRVRQVVRRLGPSTGPERSTRSRPGSSRSSIHQLPERSFTEWLEQLVVMLTACGQNDLAERIRGLSANNELLENEKSECQPTAHGHRAASLSSLAWYSGLRTAGTAARALEWRSAGQAIAGKLKAAGKRTLHRMETRYGYMLPYRLSAARRDDPFRSIEEIAREEDVKTALIIGARHGSGNTEAVMIGAGSNASRPPVICLSKSGAGKRNRGDATFRNHAAANWYTMAAKTEDAASTFRGILETVRRELKIDGFDLVLVDGSELGADFVWHEEIQAEVERAKTVVLDDINLLPVGEIHNRALRSPGLTLVDQDPGAGDGFSIFARANNDVSKQPLAQTGAAQG